MVCFSFALRKVRRAEQMSKLGPPGVKGENDLDGAKERSHREKIIRHLIDVVCGQDVIMPGVAQSSPALWTPA